MRTLLATALLLSMPAAHAAAAGDPLREQAFQDHIAYVATFAMPVLIEKCAALDDGYLQRAAPLYFHYVNANQDRIERGRLLTLAELRPDQTVSGYREQVLASRLGRLDTGTAEEIRRMCESALGVLQGAKIPGEWPSRD
ncbi:hypothetical protein [Pseudoxanthomonas suwonensis]|uniref:Secreted protein n=1 Tax=Pseudoxanthomonas suwonensis TaxID=314722 RepID=A0A0E3Z2K9_9GAMM|nr:hypothetical protein [Pseudoxanthomonas suwonensis]AKC87789.1 hypothetical protein WQ53_14505 [Pseudoxanthomonas suwonensis]